MRAPEHDRQIDYIEFAVKDLAKTKSFYSQLLGWRFEDFGPDYSSFSDGRLAGGFYTSDDVRPGGALIVIYASDLDAKKKRVQELGGTITRDTFEFPGGKRFHFSDPSGHELAFWGNI